MCFFFCGSWTRPSGWWSCWWPSCRQPLPARRRWQLLFVLIHVASADLLSVLNYSGFWFADRSHAPNAMDEPAPPQVDSVEDSFMVDEGSYDEVCAAVWKSIISSGCWSLSLAVCLPAAAGSSHALPAPLHPSPAVLSGLPATLLRPLWHLLLSLLQRYLLLSPSWSQLLSQTHLTHRWPWGHPEDTLRTPWGHHEDTMRTCTYKQECFFFYIHKMCKK